MSENTVSTGGARPFGAFEWMVARRYLGATRKGGGVSLITSIALTGIALSVMVLIVVMSVFQGFRVQILDQLLSVNGHVFVESGMGPMTEYEEEAVALAKVPGVERVTPVLRLEAYMVGPSGQKASLIWGIAPNDLNQIEEVTGDSHLRGGRFDGFGEGKNGGNEIALGWGLANALGVRSGDVVTLITAGGAETAFGRSPTTQKDYRVGAVFQIGNSFYDQYYAYMPLEQAQIFGRKKGQVSEIEVRVAEPLEIDRYLPSIRSAAPNYALSDWRDRNSDIFGALQLERGMMRIILLMIVMVATMLIISGLVMLVKDKRSDIAIMRTMGMTKSGVMRVFLLVGATIGITGTVIGTILGALVSTNIQTIERAISKLFGVGWNPEIYFLAQIPSVFEWQEVSVVVLFTLVMSFLFSAYPAWQASKLDPVEALRYE
ncbi:lipoprotein-releasing ABC transporter permease subunit [Parvularcula sp. LCG005]|uniref:lipoprotein-releasing ABC transporter permease subunit n=1 Tax=Parvularcula sp. LCG005 TaxID=3078805 RepID=UPI002943334F|nr:lipoprotein-releasing ABC transporter permease subunit [Parvularcula sp. LCG005]WOI54388.1 lipoprotein-releasing ABC transporter permease subunit [Parvularcula sp. LCG005]